MKISEIINIESIKTNLKVENKEELLDILISLADKSGKIKDKAEARREVFERENIMSTGVGKGIALPHAKTNSVSDSVGGLVTLKKPIDFDSLDGKPVKIAFLLLGMESNVGTHLRLLSKISRMMNDEDFKSELLKRENAKEVIDLFRKYET